MEKWLYVIYFWKNANKEMIEDMLTLSIDEISDYIVEMWKMFYESEINKADISFSLWYKLAYSNSSYKQ